MNATSPSEMSQIDKGLVEHLRSMQADRRQDTALNNYSEDSCAEGCDWHYSKRMLKCDIDSMDQAKVKCPRNLDSSKLLESLWRPHMSFTGCITAGARNSDLKSALKHVFLFATVQKQHRQHTIGMRDFKVMEAYYITPSDVPKDASFEITVISRSLDLVAEVLQKRGLAMPGHLIIKACRFANAVCFPPMWGMFQAQQKLAGRQHGKGNKKTDHAAVCSILGGLWPFSVSRL